MQSNYLYYGIYVPSDNILTENGKSQILTILKNYNYQCDMIIYDVFKGFYIVVDYKLEIKFGHELYELAGLMSNWKNYIRQSDDMFNILRRELKNQYVINEAGVFSFDHILV